MMRALVLSLLVLLAACGRSPDARSLNAFDVEEPPAAAQPAPAQQIAYTYALSYLLDGDAVSRVQSRHLAMCRQLGAARCIVVSNSLSRESGGATGETALLVDARIAPALGTRLDASVTDAGGEVVSRRTEAEDVTKQLVDTGARIRAKQALADRMLTLIGSANGKVADLVAAEKAYADVQEELDAARSLDAALRRRVAMSRVDLSYAAASDAGTWAPVHRAIADVGATLATSAATLFTFVVAALPWALLLAGLVWVGRRRGWRLRFRRRAPPSAP